MAPETPRSTAKPGYSLTPSFTFNVGFLPSFRFTSPQSMSLFTSLSPHRILNRFSRSKEPSSAPEARPAPVAEKTPLPALGLPKLKHTDRFAEPQLHLAEFELDHMNQHRLSSAGSDHNGSDLVTAESVDLWSLGSDGQPNITNMTTMHENTSTDEFYYSSTDFLATEHDDHPHSSPLLVQQTPSRKRKLADVDCSPSAALAAQIDKSTFPETPALKQLSASKTWTPALDNVLLQCQDQYMDYVRTHGQDSSFKSALRNKTLSRMLFNNTGVSRSAKQISSRLIRLTKIRAAKQVVSPTYSSHSVTEDSQAIFLSPDSTFSADNVPLLAMKEFSVAFDYRAPSQGSHYFTKLSGPCKTDNGASIEKALKCSGIDNVLFDKAFSQIADKLVTQKVPIFNVSASIDLKPSNHVTLTPTSPLSDPHLFTLDNGNFLTYMNVSVSGEKCKEPFISWKSAITIYKGKNTCLLESTESVNGYRNEHGDFTLEVPFLNNFWSGYLTFLTNGSHRFDELKALYILQVIYDGDDKELTNIHGVFNYSFGIAAEGPGTASVTTMVLKGSEEAEMDDNATVLASSSPARGSPGRFNCSIDTNLANKTTSLGPMSVPTYDANLLYKLNPNYSQAPARPGLSRVSSVPNPIQSKPSFEPCVMAPSYSSADLLILPSAGQNGMVPILPHAPPYNQQLQTVQSVPYSSTSLPPDTRYQECAPLFQCLESPQNGEVVQPHIAPRPIITAPQWHPLANGNVPVVAPMSAPASQLHFFQGGNYPTVRETKQTITFGPILEYDPSKSRRKKAKQSKGNPSIHKFQLTRQIMYKPKKD